MNDATNRTVPSARVPLALLVGIPLTVGLIVGLCVGLFTETSERSTSTALISTRAASDLPNERIDLITDLATALSLRPVLDQVAENNGMETSDLSRRVTVERIDSSSFARLTYTSPADEDVRREVVKDLVTAAQQFLNPDGASPALQRATRAEQEASQAYYDAIRDNFGVNPAKTVRRLQVQLTQARASGTRAERRQLTRRLDRALQVASEVDLLDAARLRASANLDAVSERAALQSQAGANGLRITYLDGTTDEGVTDSVVVRRAVAAGVATALVVLGFVLAVSWGQRRRTQTPSGTPAAQAGAGGADGDV